MMLLIFTVVKWYLRSLLECNENFQTGPGESAFFLDHVNDALLLVVAIRISFSRISFLRLSV